MRDNCDFEVERVKGRVVVQLVSLSERKKNGRLVVIETLR